MVSSLFFYINFQMTAKKKTLKKESFLQVFIAVLSP
jgi:hypothetical protein